MLPCQPFLETTNELTKIYEGNNTSVSQWLNMGLKLKIKERLWVHSFLNNTHHTVMIKKCQDKVSADTLEKIGFPRLSQSIKAIQNSDTLRFNGCIQIHIYRTEVY